MFVQLPYCTSVAWAADGATLYTGYTDGQVCFSNRNDKQLLLGLSRPAPCRSQLMKQSVVSLLWGIHLLLKLL